MYNYELVQKCVFVFACCRSVSVVTWIGLKRFRTRRKRQSSMCRRQSVSSRVPSGRLHKSRRLKTEPLVGGSCGIVFCIYTRQTWFHGLFKWMLRWGNHGFLSVGQTLVFRWLGLGWSANKVTNLWSLYNSMCYYKGFHLDNIFYFISKPKKKLL